MIFKDQDDCSKRLLCELNAMRKEGKVGYQLLYREIDTCYEKIVIQGDRYLL